MVGAAALVTAAVVAVTVGPAAAATGWTVATSPNPGTINTINGVSARTASDIWAVGSRNSGVEDEGLAMLTERWDGTAWRDVPNAAVLHHDQTLLGVSASGANDAWAVGFTRTINARSTAQLIAHWNGTAWSTGPVPTTGSRDRLAGVVAFAPDNAYAAGTGNSQAAIEHWNSSAWSLVTLPAIGPAGATTSLSSIAATSPSDIWALGTVTTISGTTVTNRSASLHFDGTAWAVVPMPAVTGPYLLNALTTAGSGKVWAVGQTMSTDGLNAPKATLTEHFDGTSWKIVRSPTVATTLTAVAARTATDVWAVGTEGATTFTMYFNGTTWSPVASPNVGTGDNLLNGVAATSSDVWAVGRTLTGAQDPNGNSLTNTLVLHTS